MNDRRFSYVERLYNLSYEKITEKIKTTNKGKDFSSEIEAGVPSLFGLVKVSSINKLLVKNTVVEEQKISPTLEDKINALLDVIPSKDNYEPIFLAELLDECEVFNGIAFVNGYFHVEDIFLKSKNEKYDMETIDNIPASELYWKMIFRNYKHLEPNIDKNIPKYFKGDKCRSYRIYDDREKYGAYDVVMYLDGLKIKVNMRHLTNVVYKGCESHFNIIAHVFHQENRIYTLKPVVIFY